MKILLCFLVQIIFLILGEIMFISFFFTLNTNNIFVSLAYSAWYINRTQNHETCELFFIDFFVIQKSINSNLHKTLNHHETTSWFLYISFMIRKKSHLVFSHPIKNVIFILNVAFNTSCINSYLLKPNLFRKIFFVYVLKNHRI